MQEKLFSEFSIPPLEEWITALSKELKGRDYREALKWNTEDAIELLPFYTSIPEGSETTPGVFPFLRGFRKENNNWEIDQEIVICDNFVTANRLALEALNGGASSITFNGRIELRDDLDLLLKGIEISYISINFRLHNDPVQFTELLKDYCEINSIRFSALTGSIITDPFTRIITNGDWFINEESDKKQIIAQAQLLQSNTYFRSVTIDATVFHNAGATPVQELAYAAAAGHEYLNLLVNSGMNIDTAAARIQFRFSSGVDLYQEIARLRAFRVIWSNIIQAYNPEHNCTHKAWIHSETSMLYRSSADQYTNLLRFTTSVFAAVCGGADAVSVLPFDAKNDFSFSLRMGRNIQLILKEESGLGKIADPAGGSYFIEHLTKDLAEKSWKKFVKIESSGGYLNEIEKGVVQEEILVSADKKKEDFRNGKLKMIGLNFYQDPKDKPAFSPEAGSILPRPFKTIRNLRFEELIPLEK
jgi:methylmalonyl-CoA mutase